MSAQTTSPIELFLDRYSDDDWSQSVVRLLPEIHEVDKAATQIWFRFYPLALLRALKQADDSEKLAAQLLLKGDYYLKDQIDSSHTFLYGHRFWPEVKRAVTGFASSFDETIDANSLADIVREIAGRAASNNKLDKSLLLGISAVALMTVQQVGLAAFEASPGEVQIDNKHARRSVEQVLNARARDDNQGIFGFLKTIDKNWTVTFDENDDSARYKMKNAADLAYGAADDRSRDWRAIDPRRGEGPIPVECRSASCGTCWVGVIGGAEKLSDVAARLEGKRMKEFGYIATEDPKPLIRLACQAQLSGAVSIVIPPWNGVYGKFLRSLNSDEATAQKD